MRIQKTVVMEMSSCYAVNCISLNGQKKLLIASEEQGECWIADLHNPGQRERVWKGPGGTMAFAQTVTGNSSFLAVQNFFPIFDSKHATVVRAKKIDDVWYERTLLNLPYVHRIDLIGSDNGSYFIGCQLCKSKQFVEDWSDPGDVVVGSFDTETDEINGLHPLITGLTKNHGYFHDHTADSRHAYVSSADGIYRITVPCKAQPEWHMEMISDEPTGDLAVIDIDGDGIPEFLTVQPFHGDIVSIKRENAGRLETVWQYHGNGKMGHIAWAGTILNKPSFIFGFRRESCELILVSFENGQYQPTVIDRGCGPANICVIHEETSEKILAANHTIGEVSLYTLTAE